MGHLAPVLTALSLLLVQAGAAWRDPSPHEMRFVTVDSNVRLEVLDWGGTGRPLLFVGCYLTAHVYDDIAPKLTDQFRVSAVTRRGVGASDRPPAGYDPQRRAADILEVMDALGIHKPIVVGNSCGGGILHSLGADHPQRVGGLVYLDAAEDPTLKLTDYGFTPVAQGDLPKRVGEPRRVVFPEAETRQLAAHPLDPAIRKAIVEDHNVKPPYARIKVPVMAVYRTDTLEQMLQQYRPTNEKERAAVEERHAGGRAMLTRWQSDLRAGVPDARIVELPGASLYMFLTHEADVVRELRAFAATLNVR